MATRRLGFGIRPVLDRPHRLLCRQTFTSNSRRLLASPEHKTYFQNDEPHTHDQHSQSTSRSWYQRKNVKGILLLLGVTVSSSTFVINTIGQRIPTTYPETDSDLDLEACRMVEELANTLPVVQEARRMAAMDPNWLAQERFVGNDKLSSSGDPRDQLPGEFSAEETPPARRGYLHQTLRGFGRVSLRLSWWNNAEKKGISVMYIGWALSGWPGVAHGGFLATILDEALGRTAIASFPARTGVTANLNVDYRKPCRVERFIVIKTETVEASDRKARVIGRIEDLEGNVLVEASGIFVVPKTYALNAVM